MLFGGRWCTNCHYTEDSNRRCSLEKVEPLPSTTTYHQSSREGLRPVPVKLQQDHQSSESEGDKEEDEVAGGLADDADGAGEAVDADADDDEVVQHQLEADVAAADSWQPQGRGNLYQLAPLVRV